MQAVAQLPLVECSLHQENSFIPFGRKKMATPQKSCYCEHSFPALEFSYFQLEVLECMHCLVFAGAPLDFDGAGA